jgi:hypothetical protein
MRIAVATCGVMAPEFTDDERLVRELELRGADVVLEPWDRPLDWSAFNAVAVRSPWDYTLRHEDFSEWARAVGPTLHNSADLMLWNSDKRYLSDLGDSGIPVVETVYLAPGEQWQGDEREVVVKPTVSAGGRDTGRFRPEAHGQARDLIAAIQASGRTAMVQPYLSSVDAVGETALVFIDGQLSHPLRKGAVLAPDEVAPVRESDLRVAEAMYDPTLVVAGSFEDDERALAERVLSEITDRFAYEPLYARVDMLRGEDDNPVLLELEAVEPNLYLSEHPEGAGRLADAIVRRASRAPNVRRAPS